MNEQLQNAVATILERAISGIDSSVEFMSAELPDVIEQLLMWHAVKGIVLVSTGLILMIPLIICIRSIRKEIKDNYEEGKVFDLSEGGGYALFASLVVAMVFALPLILFNFLDPIKIWIAPKIWLMEYAASIVK